MGRPKQFQITLQSSNAVFHPGQTVEGTVTLELEEPLTTRALRVHYMGQATVHWTEQRSNGKTTHTVVYHNEEHYFDGKCDLWTKDQSGSDEMPKGLYTYPFQFKLPEGLPCSFEGSAGNVRYMVKAVIDRRFRFDHNTKLAFTVIGDLDLNVQPDALVEINSQKQKHLCCLCCKSGPITASLHAPRKGYVPGEAIPIQAEIENLSRRTMAKTAVKILQLTEFHATTKTRRNKKKVTELRHKEIEPGKSDQWNGDMLLIPPVPPSMLQGCRIIDITYILQLNVDPTGIGLDLKVPLEILIGTIPLKQVMNQYPPLQPPDPNMPSPSRADLYSSAAQTGISAKPPPPTYSECVFGKVDIRDDEDDKENEENNSYAPAYTYYNWGFQPSEYSNTGK